MSLPKRVRVLGKTYLVRRGARIDRDLRKKNRAGEVSLNKQWVKLRSDLAQEEVAETLLHEVVHIIDDALFASCLSELKTRALSAALFQVLQDNRWWGRK